MSRSACPPETKDRVMLALGLVEGKSWPDDAEEPGPHYWRVPKPGDEYTVHMADCHLALRSTRRLAWFAADGALPFRLLARMERWPWFSPCRICWYWHLKTVETLGLPVALAMTDVVEQEQ